MKMLPAILALFILASCNPEKEEEQKDNTPGRDAIYQWGDELRTSRFFNTEEYNIGRDVCLALKDKRIFISGLADRENTLRFTPAKAGCGEKEVKGSTFEAWLRNNRRDASFEPKTRAVTMIEGILTDADDRLSSICADLIDGKNHENIVEVGGQNFSMTFLKARGRSWVYMAQFRKVRGRETLQLLDLASVATRDDANNADLIGFARERVQYRACISSREQSVRRQYLN